MEEILPLTIDTAYGGILVDQFTMTFNNAFSHTTTGTTLPGVYYLIVQAPIMDLLMKQEMLV